MKEYVKKYADFINESFINESNTKKYFDLMIKQGYIDNIVRDLDGYEDNSRKQNIEYQYKIIGNTISEFSNKNNIKLNGHDEDNLMEMILDEYFPDNMNEGGNFRIKYGEYDLGKGGSHIHFNKPMPIYNFL